ncbi:MAG: BatD family protein [Elusimicrobiota bacterium]
MKTAAYVLLALLCGAGARAQAVSVSASLDNDRISLGEQLLLTVTVSGSASATVPAPKIDNVETYESGRSQSMVIQNGSMTSSIAYSYVLSPRKPGKFRIPPLSVPGAAPTEAIEFEVLGPGAPAQSPRPPAGEPHAPAPPRPGAQAPDAFVTAALAKKRAFVNEQVTMVIRFLTAVPLIGQPRYEAPKLSGLLSEDLGSSGQGTTTIGGRVYNYSEIRTALFPVQSGRAGVGQAVVTVQLPTRHMRTGDDFFDRFFGMSSPETRRLISDPLELNVEALPPNAPDDFSGVVGALTIATSIDRAAVKVGEAVTLTVTVQGLGNLQSAAEPKRPEISAARFFSSENSFTPERSGDKAGGKKIFRTVMVPRVSGTLEIPALSASYFDSDKRAYVRVKSPPLRLNVLPGPANASFPASGPGAVSAPDVTAVSEDIRYIKIPDDRSVVGDALAAFGATRPWHALPFLFCFGSILLEWRRRLLTSDPRARRARHARATAERRLRQAAQAGSDPSRAVTLLAEALSGYFADILNQPVAGLTYKSVAERAHGGASLPRLKVVWEELDLLRFAPKAANQAEIERLASDIQALMTAFDKERK